MCALEEGIRPSVEDALAPTAAIVKDRITVGMMDAKFVLSMTSGAVQSIGMQYTKHKFITFIFIHKIANWEIHRMTS